MHSIFSSKNWAKISVSLYIVYLSTAGSTLVWVDQHYQNIIFWGHVELSTFLKIKTWSFWQSRCWSFCHVFVLVWWAYTMIYMLVGNGHDPWSFCHVFVLVWWSYTMINMWFFKGKRRLFLSKYSVVNIIWPRMNCQTITS